MSPITVEYEAVQKIKKPHKIGSTRRKMFPKTLSIETEPRSDDAGIRYDHVQKRHTVSKEHWTNLQKAEVIPPVNNKFFPEYGVLFRDHGYLLSGLKKAFLFVTVDIPKKRHIRKMYLDLPECDEWAERTIERCGTPATNPEGRREQFQLDSYLWVSMWLEA